jgi:hypothetical protein
LVKKIVTSARSSRIASQITPEGKQPKELERTRALHYSTFNLIAHFALAAIADDVGVNLWLYVSPGGGSIRKALDYLLPFATGEKPWPYQQITEYEPDYFFELLLRAAKVYGDKRYEQAAAAMRGINIESHRGVLLQAY